ncbi:hypothetical protein COK05_07820 [Bacillus cereus]|uniref:Uncharacterized protein n=1 Tax=Bacillus cereus TaxID=1396 RepID=A0A2B2LUV2_BACCE|nr:hypothetical protein [Bacillus cereus]MDR2994991.1 hypothetical protein [Bacillus cereus]PFQ48597.1 hypothetical protein COK05_07820 [Bacillus cereus]PGU00696.1 hypothetical protein COD21_30545 [Bacillus cereus]
MGKTSKLVQRYTCFYISEQVKDYIEKVISDYFLSLLAKIKESNEEEQLVISEGISKFRDLIDKNK